MDKFTTLFNIQYFDETRNIFCSAKDGSDLKYLAAFWLFDPLSGMDQKTVDILSSGFENAMPPGSFLQVGQFACTEMDEQIESYLVDKRNSTGIAREIVDRQVDLLRQSIDKAPIEVSGVKLHSKNCYIGLKVPVVNFGDFELDKFSTLATQFEQVIWSAAVPFKRGVQTDYLKLGRYLMHIYDPTDDRYVDDGPIAEQLNYVADTIHFGKKSIFFETGDSAASNFYAKALSVKRFPREANLALMNRFIGDVRGLTNQICDPYYFCLTIHYPNQDDKKSAIGLKSTAVNNQAFGPMAKYPGILNKKRDFDLLNNEVEATGAVLVEANFTAWFFARSEDEAVRGAESMRAYFKSLGFDFKEDAYILDALWANSFPINSHKEVMDGMERYNTLTSGMAMQFLPIFGDAIGSKSPAIPLLTRRGEFAGFDLFEGATNYNAIFAAQSGSGKSVLSQHMIENYNARGAQQWVIDNGESYKKLALSLGSKALYLEFHPDDMTTCINPFSEYLPENGGLEKNFDNDLGSFKALFERMASQEDALNDIESAYLEEAIKSQFKAYGGRTTVSSVQHYLHDTGNKSGDTIKKTLAIRLEAFTSQGAYGHWFNGKANVDFKDKDLVVLELGHLKDQPRLQQVVLTIMVQKITASMYKNNGRQKILWVDEAWSLMRNPIMVKNLDFGFRTARKWGGSMVVITQSISDLGLNDYTKSMSTNAYWKVVLGQTAADVDSAFESGQLPLEPYAREQMKTIHTALGKYSELMIIGETNWAIYRLVLDRFTQVMYSTSGAARTEILKNIEAGEDPVEAIKRFIVGEEAFRSYERIKQEILALVAASKSPYEMRKLLSELSV